MIDKVVKCRKDHECCYCGRTIKNGENAQFIKGKEPRYDEETHETQVGIKYYTMYYCEGFSCVEVE